MKRFTQLYGQACKELHIEPIQSILSLYNVSLGNDEEPNLNLAEHTLGTKVR
jgi:hypothetical protein